MFMDVFIPVMEGKNRQAIITSRKPKNVWDSSGCCNRQILQGNLHYFPEHFGNLELFWGLLI